MIVASVIKLIARLCLQIEHISYKIRGQRRFRRLLSGHAFKEAQGYLAHKRLPPPLDHRRVLGIVLIEGPRRALFLMREVPLYGLNRAHTAGYQGITPLVA